jgi:hypothetical protein
METVAFTKHDLAKLTTEVVKLNLVKNAYCPKDTDPITFKYL